MLYEAAFEAQSVANSGKHFIETTEFNCTSTAVGRLCLLLCQLSTEDSIL